MTDSKSARRLSGGIAIIVLLTICLAVTTFALVHVSVQVENNAFHTGTVKINLNDGTPVIREEEFLFEPGMTVKKDFFIENDSSCEIYYKLYFDQVSGGLSDVLDITIRDGAQALYSGTARELMQTDAAALPLAIGQRKMLTIFFHFPQESGNEAQNLDLSFTLCAAATQVKNNPDRQFD